MKRRDCSQHQLEKEEDSDDMVDLSGSSEEEARRPENAVIEIISRGALAKRSELEENSPGISEELQGFSSGDDVEEEAEEETRDEAEAEEETRDEAGEEEETRDEAEAEEETRDEAGEEADNEEEDTKQRMVEEQLPSRPPSPEKSWLEGLISWFREAPPTYLVKKEDGKEELWVSMDDSSDSMCKQETVPPPSAKKPPRPPGNARGSPRKRRTPTNSNPGSPTSSGGSSKLGTPLTIALTGYDPSQLSDVGKEVEDTQRNEQGWIEVRRGSRRSSSAQEMEEESRSAFAEARAPMTALKLLEKRSSSSSSSEEGSGQAEELHPTVVPHNPRLTEAVLLHLAHVVASQTTSSASRSMLPRIAWGLHQMGCLSSPEAPDPHKLEKSYHSALSALSEELDWMNTEGDPLMSLLDVRASVRTTKSRYLSDFEELATLGRGGGGTVVKAQNRLDGRVYALKCVHLDDDAMMNRKLLREVTTLSELQHQGVVRYYQAWIESGDVVLLLSDSEESDSEEEGHHWMSEHSQSHRSGSGIGLPAGFDIFGDHLLEEDEEEEEFRFDEEKIDSESDEPTDEEQGSGKEDSLLDERRRPSRVLFIQMEYCPVTLRQVIDAPWKGEKPGNTWLWMRQILQALTYIHGQGIVHRDFKPANIFFDARGDIKLGDFGLATRFSGGGALATASGLIRPVGDGSTEMVGSELPPSSAAGTVFYRAPEQIVGKNCSEKVDMFALGITFLEMIYKVRCQGVDDEDETESQCDTYMERRSILEDALRPKGPIFPEELEERCKAECELIRWCLKKSPSKRPSAKEMLESPLMPSIMEEEYKREALRSVMEEGNDFRAQVLEVLFGDPEQTVKSKSSKLPRSASSTSLQMNLLPEPGTLAHQIGSSNSVDGRRALVALSVRRQVFSAVEAVFQRHGALPMKSPLVSLLSRTQWGASNAARLLTPDGSIVTLRYDHIIPFSEFVLKNRITALRRYAIGRVFRKARADVGDDGGPTSKGLNIADFDIVGPPGQRPHDMLPDAEVIRVLCECLTALRCRYSVNVSHTRLLDGILTYCGVPKAKRLSTWQVLSRLRKPGSRANVHWSIVKHALQSELKLHKKCVEKMEKFMNVEEQSPSEMITHCEGLIAGGGSGQLRVGIAEAFADMRKLFDHLESFGVLDSVSFVPVINCTALQFYTGFIFEALGDTSAPSVPGSPSEGTDEVLYKHNHRRWRLAVGGRYDVLLSSMQRGGREFGGAPMLGSALQDRTVQAVGVSLALERVIARRIRDGEANGNLAVDPVCDVFLCSVGTDGIRERNRLAVELWEADISAVSAMEADASLGEQMHMCARSGSPWCVTLNPKTLPMVKIRQMSKRSADRVESVEQDRGDVVNFLRRALKKMR